MEQCSLFQAHIDVVEEGKLESDWSAEVAVVWFFLFCF